MNIKDIIFRQLGDFAALGDSNRESDPQALGRGTLQRYAETIAQELDDYLFPKIQNLIPYTNGDNVLDTLVPIVEQSRGLQASLYDDMENRRWLLPYLNFCERHKGTLQNYIFLLGRLGFDVVLEETYRNGTWDDGTWDNNVWDSYANINGSFHLTLNVRYVLSVTPALTAQIERIIEWNKPIHAQEVTYNIVGFEPAIELNTDVLDFGTVIVGNTPQLHFFITNVGNAPLTISEIQIPFATYTLSWGGGILAANETQQVFITFSPTSTAVQNGIITVVSNAVSGGNTISVTGQGFVEQGVKIISAPNYLVTNGNVGRPHFSPTSYELLIRTPNDISPIQVLHEAQDPLNSATIALSAIGGAGRLNFYLMSSGGSYSALVTTTSLLPNTLYHIVCTTQDGTIGNMKIYVNGVEKTTLTSIVGTISNTTPATVRLGSRTGGQFPITGGAFFKLRYYDAVLTGAQILEAYETGFAPESALGNLIHAWEMQEAQGSADVFDAQSATKFTLNGYTGGELAVARVYPDLTIV